MTPPENTDVKLTGEQLRAAASRGCNVLVSASAGTGKTKVLVERVIGLILDPVAQVSVDRLLVVTFTDAAAAEMRERISKALTHQALDRPGDMWLADQLTLLPRAHISTLHSWCLALIRDNFHRLGLDPAMRVLDEHEAELLRLEILDRVFEKLYELEDQAFLNLVDCYGDDRGDEPLRRVVLDLHSFVRGLPDPAEWLARAAAAFAVPEGQPLLGTPWGETLRDMLAGRLKLAVQALRDAVNLCSAPGGPLVYAGALGESLTKLGRYAVILGGDREGGVDSADGTDGGCIGHRSAQGCSDWDTLRASGTEMLLDWPKFPPARGVAAQAREAVQGARNRARKTAQGLLDLFLSRPEAELRSELRRSNALMAALAALVTSLEDEARRERASRGLLDFGDLEHYTLSLLRGPSPLASELRDRYDEVLVDEYQDINDVQNEILRLVSRGDNLFCIGDDKQSIYRFRGTNPELFRGMAKGKDAGAGQVFSLTYNFRSRPVVLDAANLFFRQTMTEETAEINYHEGVFLRPGSKDYDKAPDPDAPVELFVLGRNGRQGVEPEADAEGGDYRPGEELEADLEAAAEPGAPEGVGEDPIQVEAMHVAARILAMVGGSGAGPEFSVYDRKAEDKPKAERHRPVSFGDIAVLMRAIRGRANRYLEVFAQYGIPVRAELPTGYFSAIEVETMLALLEVIDNPRQDIPLAAVLRSPLVGLDDPGLAAVRLGAMREDLYGAVLAASAGEEPCAAVLRGFLERLDGWRTAARRGPLGDLVWRLLQDTDYLPFCGGLPGGAQRQANLLALYERAREFDRFAKQGLPRFLRFVRRLHETESDLGAMSDQGGQDAVLLTSIHKSKGLEFPVVFLPDLGRQMRHPAGRRDVLWHRELGLGPMLADRELGIKHPTLAWHLVDWQLAREDLAEEMRILYVAMTRARERLVLGGSVRGLGSRLQAWAAAATPGFGGAGPEEQKAGARTGSDRLQLPVVAVTTASTYLDWVCLAVARHPDGEAITRAAVEAAAAEREAVAVTGEAEARAVTGTEASGRETAGVSRTTGAAGSGPGPFDRDPSRWRITIVPDAGTAAGKLPTASLKRLSDDQMRRIAALEPLGRVPAPELAQILDGRLSWRYPHPSRPLTQAKVYASELRPEHTALGLDPDATVEPAVQLPSLAQESASTWPGPDFRTWGARPEVTTPLRRGVLTHLVLQHLELRRGTDMKSLREQVSTMIRASILRQDEAQDIDLDALTWFFDTPEGKLVLARPDAVLREVPFTLALPAREVIAAIGGQVGEQAGSQADGLDIDVAQDASGGEMILVQGVIDCLVRAPHGWVLLDFKTDRVTADAVPARAAAYAAQMAIYMEAVRTILGGPVSQVSLVFLYPRVIWEVPAPFS